MHKGRQYPRLLDGYFLPGLPWTRWPPVQLTIELPGGEWPGIPLAKSWTAIAGYVDTTSGTVHYDRALTDNGLNISIHVQVSPRFSQPGNIINVAIVAFGTPIPTQNQVWGDGDSMFDYHPITWEFVLNPPNPPSTVHLTTTAVRYY